MSTAAMDGEEVVCDGGSRLTSRKSGPFLDDAVVTDLSEA